MAASFLAGTGVDVYLPVVKGRTRSGVSVISEPLFPGYFFGRLDALDGDLSRASRTYNVLYILGNGDEALPVSDELITSIRAGLESVGRRQQTARFRTGDSVRITHGPFEGIEAVFDGYLSAAGRVRVLISTLQSAFRAELDADKLTLVSQLAQRAVS